MFVCACVRIYDIYSNDECTVGMYVLKYNYRCAALWVQLNAQVIKNLAS